ncbi:hypothetical protein GCM10007063_15920 [Lentibacillus kapialis]|uniref:Uncharacterized protein n=1 Tax=Lentibacillus kapialis TaxID=340214 RepID=A0A917PVR7_9BACI|nr:hypothetical protein [Lentibacillus kapialis]GGJ94216.1 hypothetical protein GCM10007063_15920 [Lentibacillus kapialis]
MDIDEIYIDYSREYDKELNMVHGFGSVSSFMEEGINEPIHIGSIIYNFYNMFSFNQEKDALISADAVSGDEEYIMSTLLNNGFEFEEGGALITLDRIVLKEQWVNTKIYG